MKDQYIDKVNSFELANRSYFIQKSASTPNDGDSISRLPRMQRSGTSSSDTSDMSRLPTFRKSHTTSTTSSTGSDEVSRLEVLRTIPMSRVQRESVEIGQGEFSKPRIKRRRESNESTKSQKEFQYYGRHANSWLFNDFSITDSVKRGWGKLTSKNDEEQ